MLADDATFDHQAFKENVDGWVNVEEVASSSEKGDGSGNEALGKGVALSEIEVKILLRNKPANSNFIRQQGQIEINVNE